MDPSRHGLKTTEFWGFFIAGLVAYLSGSSLAEVYPIAGAILQVSGAVLAALGYGVPRLSFKKAVVKMNGSNSSPPK